MWQDLKVFKLENITRSMYFYGYDSQKADATLNHICLTKFTVIGLNFDQLIAQRKKLIDYDKEEI